MSDYKAVYENKKKFVAKLHDPLSAIGEFAGIDYAVDHITGDEYIRLRDTLGQAFFINVTGDSHETILLEVAKLITGQRATGFVTSMEHKRRIAPMFRAVV